MVVVPLVDYGGAIDFESGYPLVDLAGFDVALVFYLPYGWEQCGIIRMSLMWVSSRTFPLSCASISPLSAFLNSPVSGSFMALCMYMVSGSADAL